MKNKKNIMVLLLFGIFALAGCTQVSTKQLADLVTTPTYQEPANKVAYFNLLPVENKKISRISVVFYNNTNDCSGISEVSGSWVNNPSRLPLKIKASKNLTFGVAYFPQPLAYCYFIASFDSVPKQTYMVLIDAQDDKCHLEINQIIKGNLIPVKLQMREQNTPFFANGSHCKPISN